MVAGKRNTEIDVSNSAAVVDYTPENTPYYTPSLSYRIVHEHIPQVLMCIADCKYDVVREAAQAKGWKLVNEDPEASTARKCHVYWIDVPAILERMQHLHRWQRINHFPGMSNVARKGRLAQNLDRMRRTFPHEYSFYPRTWVLPVEWGAFKAEFDANGKTTRTFIVKPDNGCQGRGIFLTQDLERVDAMESQVAQLYVQRPLLIEGFKFDLRLYVLVTSVIPLRVYAFKDGLTRFCTEKYVRPSSDNLGRRCMHLTNYAVNKGSENFVANDHADRDDLGSKRSLRWLLGWIASERGGQEKADTLWRKMGGVITKTLVSVMPTLHREYLHTFGPDKGSQRPAAAAGDGNRHDNDRAGGIPDGGGSSKGSPPPGGTGTEADGSGRNVSCGASARDGRSFSSASNISGGTPARQQREEHAGARPAGNSGHVPLGEGRGDSFTSPEGERTPVSETFDKAAELSGSMEEEHGSARAKVVRDTQPGLGKVGGGGGGEEVLSSHPSTSGSNVDETTSSQPRQSGGRGETSSTAASDREGVVEGSRCVEILGFDFMIDAALKPWLIEVNHLPSFATDSPLDRRIKSQVVSTALSVLHAKADDRRRYEENAKRDAQNRLYNPDGASASSAQREKERKEAEAAVAKIRKKVLCVGQVLFRGYWRRLGQRCLLR